jgi:hypothetical protein
MKIGKFIEPLWKRNPLGDNRMWPNVLSGIASYNEKGQ